MEKYDIKKLGIDFSFIQDEPIVRGSRKKMLAINNNREKLQCSSMNVKIMIAVKLALKN